MSACRGVRGGDHAQRRRARPAVRGGCRHDGDQLEGQKAIFKPYRKDDAKLDAQKRRFLRQPNPLAFLVVTAKLMTGFDAPIAGVLYLDKPLTKHMLFQAPSISLV